LHDEERFVRILTNSQFPVQLVIAGKAPPYDEAGMALIRQWIQFIQKHSLYNHVVFLSDYDVLLTKQMVQGADVWVNTPRRPWEASGTSGMKVLVNGGLNVSELDGWWAEAYTPEVGWALGDGREHGEDYAWDAREAEALYDLIEMQIVPEFYSRTAKGIPEQWISRMRRSMAILTPRFSANRAVREYTETYYLPAAKTYIQRAAGNGIAGTRIAETSYEIDNNWGHLQIGTVRSERKESGLHFYAPVQLNGFDATKISVTLYADGVNGSPAVKIIMDLAGHLGDDNTRLYEKVVDTTRAASDFTVRIVPHYEDISVPLEDSHILWQR